MDWLVCLKRPLYDRYKYSKEELPTLESSIAYRDREHLRRKASCHLYHCYVVFRENHLSSVEQKKRKLRRAGEGTTTSLACNFQHHSLHHHRWDTLQCVKERCQRSFSNRLVCLWEFHVELTWASHPCSSQILKWNRRNSWWKGSDLLTRFIFYNQEECFVE